MTATTKEYLAVIFSPYDGGSWVRGKEDIDKLARRAVRVFESDWKHLLGKFKKGVEVPVNIYDVTEHDTVHMGDRACWIEKDGERTHLPRLELLKIKA